MKTRATLALAVVAGLPAAASAQETFNVVYSWEEVIAGTITPVGSPNGVVDPGEAARVRLQVTALVNGSNAVGQNTTVTNPVTQQPVTGTIKGIGALTYDIVGDNGANTANGTWGGFIGGFVGPTGNGAPFSAGTVSPGTVQAGGNSIFGTGGSQFIASGAGVTANGTNNNVQIFRGVWQPADYSARTVNWRARASVLVPAGEQNSVLVAYALGTDQNTGDEFDIYVGKYIGSTFGTGVNIPVAPAPSSLALLGLGALVAGGRRR
ncbi:MAG: PEP-CTERM sorting domain-containing protein [Phycisphaeraceae bacterium]|nr:PEP-CTERM sorting domain-containing protein [Phycisphaeraceae bacterium]